MIAPMMRVEIAHEVVSAILQCVVLVQELDLERFGKVRAEVMRCAGLQRTFILHHAFDGCGDLRAGKSFRSRSWYL